MRQLKLDDFEVESDIRENFEAIEEYIRDEVITKTEWEHVEITIDGTYTTGDPFYYKHNIKYIPKDFLITSVKKLDNESTVGAVAILYDESDNDFIKLTCTSPGAVVRMFMGSFSE